jgi:hypothetical protein
MIIEEIVTHQVLAYGETYYRINNEWFIQTTSEDEYTNLSMFEDSRLISHLEMYFQTKNTLPELVAKYPEPMPTELCEEIDLSKCSSILSDEEYSSILNTNFWELV